MEFTFHGIRVTVAAPGLPDEWLQGLANDDSGSPVARIEIRSHLSDFPQSRLPRGVPIFRTRMVRAYGLGPIRVNLHNEKSGAIFDATDPDHYRVDVFSREPDLLHELAYFALLSLLGEKLDEFGFHRIHGLAFQAHGLTALCPWSERAGKSTLALALREVSSGEVKFYSDETPLVRGGMLHSYPLPIAAGSTSLRILKIATHNVHESRRKIFPSKYLFPWNSTELAAPAKPAILICDGGISDAKETRFVACGRTRAAVPVFSNLAIGLGVPQMREYFVRLGPRQIPKLMEIAQNRTSNAFSISRKAGAFKMIRTRDPMEDARALLGFLREMSITAG